MISFSSVCASCAASGIHNIGHYSDPVSLFKDFCKSQLVFIKSPFDPPGLTKMYNTLYTFYVFIAGPEEPGHGHSKAWVRYGTEFAKWLKNNGLGEVTTLGPKLNAKFHPTTTAQIWIWSPNQQAVENWWRTYGDQ
jgi:hypothetical protein